MNGHAGQTLRVAGVRNKILALLRVLLIALLLQPMGGFDMPSHATGAPAFGWSAQDFCQDGTTGKAPMGHTPCHHCCCVSSHAQGIAAGDPIRVVPPSMLLFRARPGAEKHRPANTPPHPYDATGPPV